MSVPIQEVPDAARDDDARLESLGYKPQLSRVLGLFANFSVAFTYLSPMVGIYSLFVLGVGTGGPGYLWLTLVPLAGMLLVALVFGELASHYPVAGALYQYSKFNVGPRYGWFVGWFYGIALLVTVASVDTGSVGYITALINNWAHTSLDPANHVTILVVTVLLLAVQTTLNTTGAKVMGRVAQFGVYVELAGTVGIAIILAIHGFHHSLGFLFSTQDVQHAAANPLSLDFGGHWLTGAALIAVLAPVYIFFGFESAGDISEETKEAGRLVPRSMRLSLLGGGAASLVLTGALLLAMPGGVGDTVKNGGVTYILGSLPSGLQDVLLIMIIFAFFSCGSSVQGAGSRLAFSYARDGSLPGSAWVARVHARFRTPVNALVAGSVVTLLFVLLVFASPDHDIKIGFITYPAKTNALLALVSFATSGIYLSFLMTVLGAIVARRRGWIPQGSFRLGRWAWPVSVGAAVYLALILLDIVYPSGVTSPRALFNIDWITLAVMAVVAVVGVAMFALRRTESSGVAAVPPGPAPDAPADAIETAPAD
ncbi:MAG TPA: APC family permease [Actinocrinis sp.]|nr:APC family permease [Actinocrinis sp.]